MNAFLESVLTTLQRAVTVVSPTRHVQIWNGDAENLWGLRAEETVDRDLLELEFGLPVAALGEPLQQVVERRGDRPWCTCRARRRG